MSVCHLSIGTALRLRQPLLLAAGLVIAVLAGEIGVRLARPGFPGFRIPQVEHRPAPGLGFEMVPNQIAFTAAERASINAHGLRGPALQASPEGSSLRVLCLGDSITFGYGVGDDDPFPQQLEGLMQEAWRGRGVEVINAGVQRYSTHQEIDFLRLRGLQLRPDVVVLAVYSNDLSIRPLGDYVAEYEKERERAVGAFRNRFPGLYTFAKNSALVELTRAVYLGAREGTGGLRLFEGVSTPRDEERWQSMARELATLSRLSREHGFFPIVVTVPARIQVQKEFPRSLYPQQILMLAAREGLESLNLLPAFRASLEQGVDPYLPWDNHLSREGHALVAAALHASLAKLPVWDDSRHAARSEF